MEFPFNLGVLVGNTSVLWPRGLNTRWYLDLNQLARHTAWAHSFMHTWALWLGPVALSVVFLIAYGVAWYRGRPNITSALFLGGVGTLTALGVNLLIAHTARELRPYDTLPHVLVLVARANDFSFPSDHSVVAGGLTVAVTVAALLARRTRPASAPLSRTLTRLALLNGMLGVFLCVGRVYVGAHYPGDVIAGYVISGSITLLVMMVRKPLAGLITFAMNTPLGIALARPAELMASSRAESE
jgi:undecaprenyl-diphosphatase